MKCQEANHVCDKSQYKEAGLWEKIRLTIHLIYCRACRKYSSQNKKLTQAIANSDLKSISPNDKKAMKNKLQEELSKELLEK